jgi:hypothetical protein
MPCASRKRLAHGRSLMYCSTSDVRVIVMPSFCGDLPSPDVILFQDYVDPFSFVAWFSTSSMAS